ncbi:MAG TPA: sortase, partial [Candidatus Saccharimonadales bacterium]|nr:sortase [Candidatus Saccharimonadales bacterium]
FNPHGNDDLSVDDAGSGSGGGDGRADKNSASDVIRSKLKDIYAEEPEALHELEEAAAKPTGRSKHQQFMYELGTSGKDLAAIQTEWHKYYESLSDREKHKVWQEFYDSQSELTEKPGRGPAPDSPHALAKHKHRVVKGASRDGGTKDIQQSIRDKVSAGGKLQARHHLQSLLFGLGMGAIVVFIFLFGFFNEVFIAPFIQPSRTEAATPIIVSNTNVAPTSKPEVIIPKINVEIPVDYTQTSTNEAIIEDALDNGVVHYPYTAVPGQNGNAAFFGHSSNNIFNQGKYKFAFVLLHNLVKGDTFYLTSKGKVYVYKVIIRKVVEPTEVGVLGPVPGQTATATLITCDPPGTSLKRLIVVGQQISPDPTGNAKATATAAAESTAEPVALPGNGPTLWGRFISTTVGKAIVGGVLLAACLMILRWLNRPAGR